MPWVALFFDTYERTGPLLDPWLRDLTIDGRRGSLPANAVVTLSGQGALDPRCWADYADLVADIPLAPSPRLRPGNCWPPRASWTSRWST
ncbi:hypothetical protein NKH77_31495 [Streptomyces sp. M19]